MFISLFINLVFQKNDPTGVVVRSRINVMYGFSNQLFNVRLRHRSDWDILDGFSLCKCKLITLYKSLDVLVLLLQGFFEEVEDLKYALQKSARLNTEYEKALKKMCKQFDVQFKPIKQLSGKRSARRSKDQEFQS